MRLPGGGTPVSDFYLPFHEDYPALLSEAYEPAGMFQLWGRNKTKFMSEFWLNSGSDSDPSSCALPSEYRASIVETVQQFRAHFTERGWLSTRFQFYLNNKARAGEKRTGVWTLDECQVPTPYNICGLLSLSLTLSLSLSLSL